MERECNVTGVVRDRDGLNPGRFGGAGHPLFGVPDPIPLPMSQVQQKAAQTCASYLTEPFVLCHCKGSFVLLP